MARDIVIDKNLCSILSESKYLDCSKSELFNVNDQQGLVECTLSEGDDNCIFRKRAIITVKFEGEAGK